MTSGLIRSLTGWILEAAFGQCARWQRQGTPMNVAVNLSTRDLNDVTLVDTIVRALDHWAIDPSWITLEITETSLMLSPTVALEVVTRLREMGMHISIDDFGTGYSSLAYLKRFPADELEIDKSFVLAMGEDVKDAAIVTAVVELGHKLGLGVVAEGVETQTALELLVSFICDRAQGYFISRPIPAEDVVPWIADFV
jgi:EAL domain-containing protein (putative c-di-GMP-specific phosphodiesterase class I)